MGDHRTGVVYTDDKFPRPRFDFDLVWGSPARERGNRERCEASVRGIGSDKRSVERMFLHIGGERESLCRTPSPALALLHKRMRRQVSSRSRLAGDHILTGHFYDIRHNRASALA